MWITVIKNERVKEANDQTFAKFYDKLEELDQKWSAKASLQNWKQTEQEGIKEFIDWEGSQKNWKTTTIAQ